MATSAAAAMQDLLESATQAGIVLSGIEPRRLHGRGLGIVATCDLEEGDEILDFPARGLRSLATVPPEVTGKLVPRVSVQSLLAVDLCLRSETEPVFAGWRELLPSAADAKAAIPFFWPAELQDLLPPAARALLATQQEKVAREWPEVRRAFPGIDEDSYAYAWFTVSTRTFYWEAPELDKYGWEDHLALVPIADFFNHAGEPGATVAFSSTGYTISAKRKHKAGEEICISYGNHPNDFLLAEYGFLLPDNNKHDKFCLDDVIVPKLSKSQEAKLKAGDLWRGYEVTPNGRCDRTEGMLALCCPKEHGRRPGARGRGAAKESDPDKIDSFFAGLVEEFLETLRHTIARIEALQVGEASQRSLLRMRWAQIEALVLGSLGSRTGRPST